jgi:hypothetical protein
MSGTHFPGGLSTVVQGDPLYEFGLPDFTKWHIFDDDFDRYVAADWTVTEVGVATQALADGDGGHLLITNAAADDNSSFSQKVGESFRWASNKKMFFKARFKVSDAVQSDVVIGLQIIDTTPLDVTDGLFFLKSDGAATMDFLVEKDNVATTVSAIATLVTDTFIEVAFAYDPNDRAFKVYVDGVYKGSAVITNAPDDEDLTISFGVQNGEAVAKTMTIDRIFAAKAR